MPQTPMFSSAEPLHSFSHRETRGIRELDQKYSFEFNRAAGQVAKVQVEIYINLHR